MIMDRKLVEKKVIKFISVLFERSESVAVASNTIMKMSIRIVYQFVRER